MGHHIDSQGRFQSDKYPDLPPDKIILSFSDPVARRALLEYALHDRAEPGLASDILSRLDSFVRESFDA